MTTLQTERLTLRPMSLDDANDIFAIYSHPDAMRFIPSPQHQTVDQTREHLQKSMSRDGAHMWAVRLKDSDTVIGQMLFLGETPVPGMGYIIHPDYWGQGITTEAARAVLEHGFTHLGYDRIELWIDEQNSASLRVAQKLNFKLRGRFANKFQHNPTHHWVTVWGMLAEEWNTSTEETKRPVEFFSVEPVLYVRDVQATAEYYRDVLGFDITFLYGDPPNHAGVSRGMWSGSMVSLQLSQIPPEREITPSAYLHIRVDMQLDALHDQYATNGVEIVSPPEDKPWGFREFTIKDMNGHVIIFARHL